MRAVAKRGVAWRAILGLAAASVLWHQAHAAGDATVEDERFIGWKGETHTIGAAGSGAAAGEAGAPLMRTLAWAPTRVFHYRGFASAAECQQVVDAARAGMAAAGSSGGAAGQPVHPCLTAGPAWCRASMPKHRSYVLVQAAAPSRCCSNVMRAARWRSWRGGWRAGRRCRAARGSPCKCCG